MARVLTILLAKHQIGNREFEAEPGNPCYSIESRDHRVEGGGHRIESGDHKIESGGYSVES